MLPRAPDLPRHDEPRLLQHAQVLHDAEAGHLELRLQLAERPSAALEQPVEEQPSGRVRERLEHTVLVVLHGARIRDRVVTRQGGTTAWHPPATTPRKGVQACFQINNGRASSASSTLVTFVTAIAALALFQPVLDDPAGYIATAGQDNRILFAALPELLLIIAKAGLTVRAAE